MWWLLAVLAVPVVLLAFGPRPAVGPARAVDLPDDLNELIASDAALRPWPGAGKSIRWAGEAGRRTPLALVYIPGFAADGQEIAPVPERVAARLGANLFVTRMTGHGLPGEALGRATAADWLGDVAEALAVGRRLGHRVVLIACSTGAAAAVVQAVRGDAADGYVFVSPNFRVNDRFAALLDWGFAETYVRWVIGRDYDWPPKSPEHGLHNTLKAPSGSLIRMAAMVRHARRADLSTITAPLLALFDPGDRVVDARATRRALARWGGPVRVESPPVGAGMDPWRHVVAGDILSPAGTGQAVEQITAWTGRMFES